MWKGRRLMDISIAPWVCKDANPRRSSFRQPDGKDLITASQGRWGGDFLFPDIVLQIPAG